METSFIGGIVHQVQALPLQHGLSKSTAALTTNVREAEANLATAARIEANPGTALIDTAGRIRDSLLNLGYATSLLVLSYRFYRCHAGRACARAS
jgi:hypothetical protein